MQVLDFGGYLERAARLYGTRPAVVSRGDRLTWSQLHRRADELAVGLTDLGLRPGDRVADLRANGVDSMVAEFALALAGLVRVPLNPRFTPDEVARLVAGIEAHALLTAARYQEHATAVRLAATSVRHIITDGVPDAVVAEGATIVKIVPTVLYRLLQAQRRRPRDLSSLRLIIYGAAPMPEQLIREAFDLFDCGFAQVYGQAEAQTTIACLTERDHERERRSPTGRLRSVGRPYSMTDVARFG